MSEIIRANAAPAPNPLRPNTYAEMERFCVTAARSGMVPTAYSGKPDAILIAVQMGTELGLSPMQALLSIAVINGRPAVFGDAMPGLVRASGVCEWITETSAGAGDAETATCSSLRSGDPSPTVRTFSVSDAKKAGLWGKTGPWGSYPSRMLAMRARSWCLRDAYPDVLRGLIAVEEARDIPVEGARREYHPAGPVIEATVEPEQPAPVALPKRTAQMFLDELERQLSNATTSLSSDAVLDQYKNQIVAAREHLTNGALTRLNAILIISATRWVNEATTGPATDDEGDF